MGPKLRVIVKKREPRSLAEHRATAKHVSFDNFDSKDELRSSLAEEQQFLCCYCMSRIWADEKRMKIEHWEPQSLRPDLQLSYENLFGACLGGQGQPLSRQHCDTRKGDSEIELNPLKSFHVTALRYSSNGDVGIDQPNLSVDLNERLNLNCVRLTRNRRDTLTSYITELNKQFGNRPWPASQIRKELQNIEVTSGGAVREYVGILRYWLLKKLAQIEP